MTSVPIGIPPDEEPLEPPWEPPTGETPGYPITPEMVKVRTELLAVAQKAMEALDIIAAETAAAVKGEE